MGKASNPQMGKQRHRRNFGPQHSDVSEDHAYVDIDDATNGQFLFLLLLSRHPCHSGAPPPSRLLLLLLLLLQMIIRRIRPLANDHPSPPSP